MFWLGLILVHAPAIWAVGGRLLAAPSFVEAPLGSALALLLTLAFFGLKLVDAPLLRWRGRRTQTIALLLAFAVAHHEALPAGEILVENAPVVLTIGGLTAEALLRRRRLNRTTAAWRRLLADLVTRLAQRLALTRRAWAEAMTHRPPAPSYSIVEAPSRAPPVSR